VLGGADFVTTSDLTLIECDRSLLRVSASATISGERAGRLRATLARTAGHWSLLPISREIVTRARQPFPLEPVRSLDAIHLASALMAADFLPDLVLLSFDRRVRAVGVGLGLTVAPG
jgi:predicted nucleic acid-binding protein